MIIGTECSIQDLHVDPEGEVSDPNIDSVDEEQPELDHVGDDDDDADDDDDDDDDWDAEADVYDPHEVEDETTSESDPEEGSSATRCKR